MQSGNSEDRCSNCCRPFNEPEQVNRRVTSYKPDIPIPKERNSPAMRPIETRKNTNDTNWIANKTAPRSVNPVKELEDRGRINSSDVRIPNIFNHIRNCISLQYD